MVNEFKFFNELKRLISSDLTINNKDDIKLAKYHTDTYTTDDNTSKNTSTSNSNVDSTNNDTNTSNTNSNGKSNTKGTTDSEGTDKSRGLSSTMPHSNVESSLTANVDTPIKWKYATSINDSYGKNNTSTNTTGEVTDTNTSNTTGNSNSVGNTKSTSQDESNGISNSIGNSNTISYKDFDILKLGDLQNIQFDEPFTRLINEIIKYCMCFEHYEKMY